MNDWKDRKPHKATQEMISAEWGLLRQRLSCALCGYVFKVGDVYRWCYMNSATPSPGNFFVCGGCDHEGLEGQVRDGMRRRKPHMHEWVLLYLLEGARTKYERLHTARHASEWKEQDGPALWHRMPIKEPPYLGDPLCSTWPYEDEAAPDLFWTPLPDCNAIQERFDAARKGAA